MCLTYQKIYLRAMFYNSRPTDLDLSFPDFIAVFNRKPHLTMYVFTVIQLGVGSSIGGSELVNEARYFFPRVISLTSLKRIFAGRGSLAPLPGFSRPHPRLELVQ